jgi:hypothetical protein
MAAGGVGEKGMTGQEAEVSAVQDLQLSGRQVISYRPDTARGGQHILVFEDGFSMSIGAEQFFSDKGVVWLKAGQTRYGGRGRYEAQAYLAGNVSDKRGKGVGAVGLSRRVVEKGESMVVDYGVSGGVFVTADSREIEEAGSSEFYRKTLASVSAVGPESVERKLPRERRVENPGAEGAGNREVSFRYPVNISPAGEAALKVEQTREMDGTYVVTSEGGADAGDGRDICGDGHRQAVCVAETGSGGSVGIAGG